MNNINQIQVSEEEMKEALRILLGIDYEKWTWTHDDIFKEFKKVKEDILNGEITDGDTINEAKEDFKIMYDFFSKKFRRYGKSYILKAVIKFIAEGRVSKEEIEGIYKEKTEDLLKEKKVDILENTNYIYIATVVIILE